MGQDEILIAYMSEHYAHARDHESLRAQITSILCAAAFVMIGLAIDKHVEGAVLIVVGSSAIALALLNWRLNRLHVNRFDAHVAVAERILSNLETHLWPGHENAIKPSVARKAFDEIKMGSLSRCWNLLPLYVGFLGSLILIYGLIQMTQK